MDNFVTFLIPVLFAGLVVSWVLVPDSATNLICFVIFVAICGGLCILEEKLS